MEYQPLLTNHELPEEVAVSIVDVVTTRQFNLYAELMAFLGQSDPKMGSEPEAIYAAYCRWVHRGTGNFRNLVSYPHGGPAFADAAALVDAHTCRAVGIRNKLRERQRRPGYSMTPITQILNAIDAGDPSAAAELLPLVYEELRKLAASRLANEKAGQTLEPTALVHEAYLRLVGDHRGLKWDGRGHFFASAAEAMRRIMIENARRKQGPRRGGDCRRIDADLDRIAVNAQDIDLLDLDEALARLAAESPVRAELVKLRFFAGLKTAEAAEVLGISVATAERYWAYAKVRLYTDLAQPEETF